MCVACDSILFKLLFRGKKNKRVTSSAVRINILRKNNTLMTQTPETHTTIDENRVSFPSKIVTQAKHMKTHTKKQQQNEIKTIPTTNYP